MASKIRGRIIEAALHGFAAKGFHGCSTRDISAAANVTEGSLYRLCESKEVLFSLVVQEILSRLIPIKAFRNRLAVERDFPNALTFAVDGIRISLTRDITRVLLFALMDGNPDLERQCARHFALYRSAIARRTRKAAKEKQLPAGIDARRESGRLLADLIRVRCGFFTQHATPEHADSEFTLVAARWLEALSQQVPRNRSKRS